MRVLLKGKKEKRGANESSSNMLWCLRLRLLSVRAPCRTRELYLLLGKAIHANRLGCSQSSSDRCYTLRLAMLSGKLSILWPNAYLPDVLRSLKSAIKDLRVARKRTGCLRESTTSFPSLSRKMRPPSLLSRDCFTWLRLTIQSLLARKKMELSSLLNRRRCKPTCPCCARRRWVNVRRAPRRWSTLWIMRMNSLSGDSRVSSKFFSPLQNTQGVIKITAIN